MIILAPVFLTRKQTKPENYKPKANFYSTLTFMQDLFSSESLKFTKNENGVTSDQQQGFY